MIAAALLIAAAAADPVAGTWEGTSLCQVKPSPCHDEHVIYRFTKTGTRQYRLEAYKVVNGQEQYMGPIDFSLDASAHLLTGSNRDRAGVAHPLAVHGPRHAHQWQGAHGAERRGVSPDRG